MSEYLLGAAKAFKKLLAVEYDIVVAHKGMARYIRLKFMKEHFYHLCGLQYAYGSTHVRTLRKEEAFDLVMTEKLTDNDIFGNNSQVSRDRILCVKELERILDGDDLYFLWDYRRKTISKIKAEYLISSTAGTFPCFIFIENANFDGHYCKSLFSPSKDNKEEYLKGLTNFTLLYKRKRILDTGECILQHNMKTLTNTQFEELGIP